MVSPTATLGWSPSHLAAAPDRSARADGRRRARRTSVVVTSLSAGVALWLGLTAPSVSPVAPGPAPAVTTEAVTAGTAPGPTAAVPTAPAVAGPRGGRGRGR